MKLVTKLTLFNTVSKLAIALLFIFLLPLIVNNIVSQYTNYYLRQQKDKVLKQIQQNSIEYYLQGQESYGSYTMLKEEYVSLEPGNPKNAKDIIETSLRVVEDDTLLYRVLRHPFTAQKKSYLLEVGKTTATISQYGQPLQRIALFVLMGLIFLTILFDLIYTRFILRPLNTIITTKLVNRKFPFKEALVPVKTTTSDFIYLDVSLVSLMEKIREAFDKEREFTSNASHELMTPISILQNKLENLMVDTDISEQDLQEKIITMMSTLNRLKKIVRSLLLISRIENDQYVKDDTINLSHLIREIIEELSDRIEAKGLQVEIRIPNDLQVQHMNHDLIFQLFYNLINNAIRYNKDNGAITITAKRVRGGNCELCVEDTGIGIDAAELNSIFNRFRKSRSSAEDGHGLGLSIVKSIALYHSVKIEVNSVLEKGSSFSVSFPADVSS